MAVVPVVESPLPAVVCKASDSEAADERPVSVIDTESQTVIATALVALAIVDGMGIPGGVASVVSLAVGFFKDVDGMNVGGVAAVPAVEFVVEFAENVDGMGGGGAAAAVEFVEDVVHVGGMGAGGGCGVAAAPVVEFVKDADRIEIVLGGVDFDIVGV